MDKAANAVLGINIFAALLSFVYMLSSVLSPAAVAKALVSCASCVRGKLGLQVNAPPPPDVERASLSAKEADASETTVGEPISGEAAPVRTCLQACCSPAKEMIKSEDVIANSGVVEDGATDAAKTGRRKLQGIKRGLPPPQPKKMPTPPSSPKNSDAGDSLGSPKSAGKSISGSVDMVSDAEVDVDVDVGVHDEGEDHSGDDKQATAVVKSPSRRDIVPHHEKEDGQDEKDDSDA